MPEIVARLDKAIAVLVTARTPIPDNQPKEDLHAAIDAAAEGWLEHLKNKLSICNSAAAACLGWPADASPVFGNREDCAQSSDRGSA